jgi:hypothetical protein
VVDIADFLVELGHQHLLRYFAELPADKPGILENVRVDEVLKKLAVDVAGLVPQKLLSGVHGHKSALLQILPFVLSGTFFLTVLPHVLTDRQE